jgi:hypothetical protein
LVYSIHDPTEEAIKKMVEASQRMIIINSQEEVGGLNLTVKRYLELQIKTLETAPRDADKLERLLKAKQRKNGKAMYIEDTQRLVTEIEMLKVVLYLVMSRKQDSSAPLSCKSSIENYFNYVYD